MERYSQLEDEGERTGRDEWWMRGGEGSFESARLGCELGPITIQLSVRREGGRKRGSTRREGSRFVGFIVALSSLPPAPAWTSRPLLMSLKTF